MVLLLTILSVLALWAFLTVVVIALLMIRKTLEAIRRSLEQITMGVRAIEVQTVPLGPRALDVAQALAALVADLGPLADTIASVETRTAAAAPALRRLPGGSRA